MFYHNIHEKLNRVAEMRRNAERAGLAEWKRFWINQAKARLYYIRAERRYVDQFTRGNGA